MSVTYYLTKGLRVKDLKEKGYNVVDNRGKEDEYPIVIKDEDTWLAISEYHTDIQPNIDDTEFYRLEGRGFFGGIGLMANIAKDFDLGFVDDETYEEAFFREQHFANEEEATKYFQDLCDKFMSRLNI